ncbi:MAG: CBS domain-containing protein [Proteobacteria bacterium]|nr:CBS domain-containing protein [Pseudomonadota bacterium]MBU1057459.1 CBS domain-containing protein [Pseudomonadota bacterium]
MGFNDEIGKVVNWNMPSVDMNDSLKVVIKKMVDNRTAALAVTLEGTVAGVITDMDIMSCIDNGLDLGEVKASRFMSSCELISDRSAKTPCVQLDAAQTVENALGVMSRAGTHHLLVTGEGNKEIGIISILELLELAIS